MIVLESLVLAVWQILNIALTLYTYILIARALLSWVNPDPYNPIVLFLHRATEPVLRPVREKLPHMGGIDLSVVVVILAIIFLQTFLGQLIGGILHGMSSSPAAPSSIDYDNGGF